MRPLIMRLIQAIGRSKELQGRGRVRTVKVVGLGGFAMWVVLGYAGCAAWAQGAYKDEPVQQTQAQLVAAPPQFASMCALCHGKDAKGTTLAPTLVNSAHVQAMSESDIENLLRKGKGKMPAMPYSADTITALARYVLSLNQTGGGGLMAQATPPAQGPPQGPPQSQGPPWAQAESQGGEAPRQFAQTCSLCHGNDARGTDRAPTLVNPDHFRPMQDAELSGIIEKGKGKMPGFPLPPDEVQVLVRYIRGLNAGAGTAPGAGRCEGGRGDLLWQRRVRELPCGAWAGRLDRAGFVERGAKAAAAGLAAGADRPERERDRGLRDGVGAS